MKKKLPMWGQKGCSNVKISDPNIEHIQLDVQSLTMEILNPKQYVHWTLIETFKINHFQTIFLKSMKILLEHQLSWHFLHLGQIYQYQ